MPTPLLLLQNAETRAKATKRTRRGTRNGMVWPQPIVRSPHAWYVVPPHPRHPMLIMSADALAMFCMCSVGHILKNRKLSCRRYILVDCRAMNSTFETIYEAAEQLAATFPANPAEPYFAAAWMYMVDNYSKFTIANWFSILWHEVRTGAHTSARRRVRVRVGTGRSVLIINYNLFSVTRVRWCTSDCVYLDSRVSSYR